MEAVAPTNIEELKAALEAAVQQRALLQADLEQARQASAPFDGMGEIIGLPVEITSARQAARRLPGEITEATKRIDELGRRLADLLLDEVKTDREGRDFWFRPLMLSLQIGNGAAFVAIVTGLLHAEIALVQTLAALVWVPAMYFGIGVAAAGLLRS